MGIEPDLTAQLGPLKLRNPVVTASGTFGFGAEWEGIYDLSALGAITVKAVTVRPRPGNPMPRTHETAAGMLNAIGLQNPGLEAFILEKLPYLRQFDVPVIVNIAADRLEDFCTLTERLDSQPGVHAFEVNISCPNQACGGIEFGVDPALTAQVISAVRARTRLPLIAKLTPNVTDIRVIARAAADAGADALSLVNTYLGTAIDVRTRRFRIANRTAGLSGPCIKPLALCAVWRVAEAVDIPILGMGGIRTAEDALEFLLAGADAIAIGTANFTDPRAAIDVVAGIRSYMIENDIPRIADLVGAVRPFGSA